MRGAKITLGGRDFVIEPLKLGQLRALLDALDDLSGKTGGAVIDAAARVIQAGLARTNSELTLDAVLELDATMDEVTAAVAVILGVAGLSKAGEAMPVTGPGARPKKAAATG